MQIVNRSQAQKILEKLEAVFEQGYYLDANEDVSRAGIEPLGHFILSGINEGRAPSQHTRAEAARMIVIDELGRLPSKQDLEALYKVHRTSQNFLKRAVSRIKSYWRRAFGTISTRLSAPRMSAQELLEQQCELIAFNALNDTATVYENEKDAVEYLLSEGYRALQPLDFHLVPDLDFFRSLYSDIADLSDEDAYSHWLNSAFIQGHFISEAHLLKHHGCRATRISHSFPYQFYKLAYTDIPSTWSNEKVLHHFIVSGIPEGRFGFDIPEDVVMAIVDAIESLAQSNPAQAFHAAEKALIHGVDNERLRILIAKNYIQLDRLLGAKYLLNGQTSLVPETQFWLNYHQSQLEKRLGNAGSAIENMHRATEIESDSFWTEGEAYKLNSEIFAANRRRAARFLELGQRETALLELDKSIASAHDNLRLFGVSEQSGYAQLPCDDRQLRIGILADNFLPQCKLYRVDQKVEQLQKAGVIVDVYDFREDAGEALHVAGNYDAWIIYRVPAFLEIIRFVKTANALGRPTIYEIDDFLFDPEHYPEDIEAFDGSMSTEEHNGLIMSASYTGGLARLCTHGLASTPSLAKELARYVKTGEVIVHRNALSAPHYKAIASIEKDDAARSPAIKLFYGSGTRAHKDFYSEVFIAALEIVMEKYGNVEFHAVGYVDTANIEKRFPDRVFQSQPEWDISQYWNALSEADINVAVLKKSLLTDCKSEIKWMEAGMLGIPSVVSETATMMEIISDGSDGALASTKDDWVRQLSLLCENRELRESIGQAAKEKVLRDYGLDRLSKELHSSLLDLTERAAQVIRQKASS